jgi:anhydro-N-acetylmuramic acid kinase
LLSIGLMSGTSMDGIDAALLETDGTPNHLKALGHCFLPYSSDFMLQLKAAEYTVKQCHGNMEKAHDFYPQGYQHYLHTLGITPSFPAYSLKEVIEYSTLLHAKAVHLLLEKTKLSPEKIDLIGYHGQTLFHAPSQGISIIIGEAALLAAYTQIRVINDFRTQDMLHGGQGAPLAPLYHQALAIRDHHIPLVVVNCGGIANLTLICSEKEGDVIGFDTGPGNALIDSLVKQRTQGKEKMDRDGQYGIQGKIHEDVLEALFSEAIINNKGQHYFSLPPPKSLDYGDMTLISLLDPLSLEDACATLEAFTAQSIVNGFDLLNVASPSHWILAGGGWNNPVIREELITRLAKKWGEKSVLTADEAGWNSQAMEAELFAYLAVRAFHQKPISFPSMTGVSKALSGGQIYAPPNFPFSRLS